MLRLTTPALVLSAYVTAIGCSGTTHRTADETQLHACRTNDDCADVGSGYACVEKACTSDKDGGKDSLERPDTGAGGSPAAGGAPAAGGSPAAGGTPAAGGSGGTLSGCDDGSAQQPLDCAHGVGGALYVPGCDAYEPAGLKTLSCQDDAGGIPPLATFCAAHDSGLSEGPLGYANLWRCIDDTGVYDMNAKTLAPDVVCGKLDRAALRRCVDTAGPCNSRPLCVGDGVYGCDDIRKACSGVTDAACHSGFDDRTFEQRGTIHDCLLKGQQSSDASCVDTFYRCAWGL